MLRTSHLALPAVLALVLPAVAAAAPPPNDNYLASEAINMAGQSLPRDYGRLVDTTEATTQPDTFDPDINGLPLGGGAPEPTSCRGGPSFGRTVWYDFVLPRPGGVEIVATGVNVVVAVREWDSGSKQLGPAVICQDDSSGLRERVLLQRELRVGQNYTVQLGGVGGAGGPLEFDFTYYPDTDGDGILDQLPDECRRLPGIAAFGGCPPVVRGSPRLTWEFVDGGIRLTRVLLDGTARGARIEARCGKCGSPVRKIARRAGAVRLDRFEGRVLGAGERIEIRLSQRRTRAGRYRFGAIGKVFTWPVKSSGAGPRRERCTVPGSQKTMRCP
jgi:hypothetical protein